MPRGFFNRPLSRRKVGYFLVMPQRIAMVLSDQLSHTLPFYAFFVHLLVYVDFHVYILTVCTCSIYVYLKEGDSCVIK